MKNAKIKNKKILTNSKFQMKSGVLIQFKPVKLHLENMKSFYK